MTPTIDDLIYHKWCKALWSLRNDDSSTPFIEFLVEPIAVEGFVGEQVLEINAINEWRNADGVISVAGQEDEADKIAQCIGQGEDFGRPTAFRLADGLVLSPPFAPCPWR